MAASFLVVPPVLSACIGDGDSNGRSEPQQSVSVGVVSLPLEATAPSGAVYRLVGEFDVMGTTELSISSEDHAGETSINQALPVGNYTVTLATGWELLRHTEDGDSPASNPTLLSAQSQWFSIEDGQVTEVVYAFEVDGETAATGGTLELSVTVQERGGTGGAGGGDGGTGNGGTALGNRLLFTQADAGQIISMDLQSLEITTLVNGLEAPSNLRIVGDDVYFTQWSCGDMVRRVPLAGGEVETLFDGSCSGAQGLAVDSGAGLVFWGEYYSGLYVGALNGDSGTELLVRSEALGETINGVGRVEVDSTNRLVYFSSRENYAETQAYWRVAYDGTGLTLLIRSKTANSLYLDLERQVLYFDDIVEGSQYLMSANLEGQEVRALFPLPENTRCSDVLVLDDLAYLVQEIGVPYDIDSNLWRTRLDGSEATLIAAFPLGVNDMVLAQ